MKTTWKEFIEWAIPNEIEREAFRVFVKNAITGVCNDKAMLLFGSGANGKSVLANLLCNIVGESGFVDSGWISRSLPLIEGTRIMFIDDGLNGLVNYDILEGIIDKSPIYIEGHGEYARVSTDFPSIIIVENKLPKFDGVLSRSFIINMPNIPEKPNPQLLSELIEDLDTIKEWFLA